MDGQVVGQIPSSSDQVQASLGAQKRRENMNEFGDNIEVRFVEGPERERALALEEKIFLANNYPYNYHQWDPYSRVFAAYDGTRLVGVIRTIPQSPLEPPVLIHCELWEPAKWRMMAGEFEELATQAVLPEYEHQFVGMRLLRAAYTDGRRRGVKAMAVITEPENVEKLNTEYSFACVQIGEVGFLGWACAPFIHVFDDVERKMAAERPDLYRILARDVPPELLAAPLPEA